MAGLPLHLSCSEMVPLRGGVVVPEPALWLALHLESRGYLLSRQNGRLAVSRKNPENATFPNKTATKDNNGTKQDKLTDVDRELIAKWRDQLLVLVDYCDSSICWGES